MRETSTPPAARPDIGAIFRTHGDDYRRTRALTSQQHLAMRAIESCRTAAMGGHVDMCNACGHQRPSYNSCRNRHCPKCQSLAQYRWLEQRKERILPTSYFHVVFTLPAELRALALRNQRALYGLLMTSAAQTLLALGRDPKRLGAQLGVTIVLHTWSRALQLHPHAHCIVTAGGLDDAGERWIATRPDYLFPVVVMGALFRGKFLDGLDRLYAKGVLDLGDGCELTDPLAFERFKARLYRRSWVVYCKRPFGGPAQVYAYLGRYTHRVAISNARLVKVTPTRIRFKTKYGCTATVTPHEFIRRLLLHVLPKGFVKIRHYGLKASSCVATKLERARALLTPAADPVASASGEPDDHAARVEHRADEVEDSAEWQVLVRQLTGIDVARCPRCDTGALVRLPLSLAPAAHESSAMCDSS